MRALSVRQPWAYCLFHGKDIENRIWPLPVYVRGQLVAIHASNYKRWSWEELHEAQAAQLNGHFPNVLPLGALIGVGRFLGCVTKMPPSLWFEDYLYGWIWQSVLEFKTPIPCSGRPGFFAIPPELEGALREQGVTKF